MSREAWRWVAVAMALGAYAGFGVARGPTTAAIGSPGAEIYGHLWVQDWVAAAWPALPAVTTGLAGGPEPWVVMDPVPTWIVAGLAQLLGGVLAWNLVVVGAVALAFLGGAALSRALGGDPLTGGVVLAVAPAFWGSLASGLSEDLAYGAVPLALAALLRPGWRWAALAGAALGGVCWCGLYLGLIGALAAVVLGLGILWGDRLRWRELALAAVLAIALAVPALARHGSRLEGEGHRRGEPPMRVEPHWRLNPVRGADVASFVAPGWHLGESEPMRLHPEYVGLVALAAAAFARGRSRVAWGVVAIGLLLAPGPVLRVLGWPTGIPNPLPWVLSALPGFGLVNHWGRLGLLVPLGLAPLAAVGAVRLAAKTPYAAALPILVFLDAALLSPLPGPLPVASAEVPAIYGALDDLPAGPVLVVPSAGPRVPPQRPLFWQRAHHRPVWLDPNRPGYGRAESVPLVWSFLRLPGGATSVEVGASDFRRLEELGIAVLVVEDPYSGIVEEALGPPTVVAEGGVAYDVSALAAERVQQVP